MQNDQKDDTDFHKTSIFELTLIGIVLLLSISALLWLGRGNAHLSPEFSKAVIYQGDKRLEDIKLEKDQIIILPDESMQIMVKEGKIKVLSSKCSKQICVNRGWIKNSGEAIVCVPNQVLIEIEAGQFPALDAVVH